MKYLSKLILLAFLTVLATANAEIKLPAIFSDGMLMQQKTNANIWGKATPKSQITLTASWDKTKFSTQSDEQGNWKISIKTPSAGGPYTLTVTDGKPFTVKDILIGELWLCSGQSNMEMPMKGFKNQPVEGANMDILKSTNPNLRLFTVKRNSTIEAQTDITGQWQAASPESVGEFSATGYYFGRSLQETLHVPVGLVNSSWGGSCIEAWMTEDMLRAFPSVKIPKTEKDIKEKNRTPTTLYQAMIHPIVGLTIKGVIWYQGESNYDRANTYAGMFTTMIKEWRKNWGQKDTIPFYYCQIAPFDYSIITEKGKEVINSAYLREAQAKVEVSVPATGMAVLLDAGLEKGIHPVRKQIAGERLALLALTKSYAIKGVSGESPYYKGMEIHGDTVQVSFERAPMWIAARNFESKLFTVAGADKVFYPAKAWIVRSKMYVKSDAVKIPVAVRYGFENYVEGDLFSNEGLPVSSFRSDNW
ncbi:MAG: sialate O-acetylesterase [Paludibacter sp.]|nr:sialate O-acetylesterase [Paludibacter sp.]